MKFTARYHDDNSKERSLCCPASVRYPETAPNKPLIARIDNNKQPIVFSFPQQEYADEMLAYNLAQIVSDTLRGDLAIDDPAMYVLLFPVDRYGAYRIKVPLTRRPGMSIGVPTIDGKIHSRHAYALTFLMAHEATEAFMVFPNLGSGARLYGDEQNRWIGDGIANLVASHALDKAVQKQYDIAPVGYPEYLLTAYKERKRSIRLTGWRPGQKDNGRYAAAEYLCWRWYHASIERGRRQPIVEFISWLQTYPKGPSHTKVLEWMTETSGIDMRRLAEDVPIEDILRYHNKRFIQRGWEIPEDAAQFN